MDKMFDKNISDLIEKVSGYKSIVISSGCAQPTTLLNALIRHADQLDDIGLYSGIQVDYDFIKSIETSSIRYNTWHPGPQLRDQIKTGLIDYYPVRASEVHNLLRKIKPEVFFARITPPDEKGFCNLGTSTMYSLDALDNAEFVVGEIDVNMPRTFGVSPVHESKFDAFITSEHAMPVYRMGKMDDENKEIIERLLELLPKDPVLQLGIGAIPEAFAYKLMEVEVGELRMLGMITDSVVDLHESGVFDDSKSTGLPPLIAVELMGSRRLMEFADQNTLLRMSSSRQSHEPLKIGASRNFVSINSALEIDLGGQVNSEAIAGKQLSGVGGSFDFCEAARVSEGGMRIVAISSTALAGKKSSIVSTFSQSDPVTIPRHSCDVVVTEYGVAHLSALNIKQRADALISIAHPDFRDELANSLS
jgi:4-hydroxybutyrate CoA-transferase